MYGYIGEKPPSDYRLMAYLMAGLLPDIIVLVIWTSLYPFDGISAAAGSCESQYADIFLGLLFCFKVPAGAACLYFGYSLRKLHDVYHASYHIITIISSYHCDYINLMYE